MISPSKSRLTELRALVTQRWQELPAALRTSNQVAGVASVACGATHSVMERCNFACTSCYLSEIANATPPLPFAEVKAQLDALRAHLGPWGKVQITSGEVTLLPLQDLGRIVAYARSLDLDPMVMTNGARFLDDPEYLTRLVRDYGLEKISIHIDATQRGRDGWYFGMPESELMDLRSQFAELIRRVRKETGKTLHVAHTVTVTPETADQVPEIVAWTLAHADAFRLISFQPVAEVGRTKDRGSVLDLDALWDRICAPMGRRLNPRAMQFGHPECNITVPVITFAMGDAVRVFETVREASAADRRFFAHALRVTSTSVDTNGSTWAFVRWIGKSAFRHPSLWLGAASYALRRGWSDRRLWAALALRGLRFRPVRPRLQLYVIHKFMDAAEMATPLGQERLQGCVFKVPVGDRMVSMCELNAGDGRRNLNESMQQPRNEPSNATCTK